MGVSTIIVHVCVLCDRYIELARDECSAGNV